MKHAVETHPSIPNHIHVCTGASHRLGALRDLLIRVNFDEAMLKLPYHMECLRNEIAETRREIDALEAYLSAVGEPNQ